MVQRSIGLVTIHSKVIVIDPFGVYPMVVISSHNLGPKASFYDDEIFLVIRDRELAEEYAVNVMSVYEHYRWRYSLFRKNTDFKSLKKDPFWISKYINSQRCKELDFWLSSQYVAN